MNTIYSLKSIRVWARAFDRIHFGQTCGVSNAQTSVVRDIVVIKVLFAALIPCALLWSHLLVLIHRRVSSHPVGFGEFTRRFLWDHWVLSAIFKSVVLHLEAVGMRVGCQVQPSPGESLVLNQANFTWVVGFFYHSNILSMRMLVKYLLTHQMVGSEVAIGSRYEALRNRTVVNLKRIEVLELFSWLSVQ